MAFRILVADPGEWYRAVGVVHQRWPVVFDRFKDFISTPKRNGYKSIHTTVLHEGKTRIEIQIRTRRMHEEAEFGAGSALGVQAGRRGSRSARKLSVDRGICCRVLHDAATPEELLENARMAMFQDQVFVFTPKGALIQLPKGSTPVDFAYAVHSELGDTCVGAKVNNRVVALRTELVNGDQVDILRSKAKAPDPAWGSFVVSAKARAAVRRFVRAKERDEGLTMGRKLLESVAARVGVTLTEDAVAAAALRLKLGGREALELAMAKNLLTDEQVAEALAPGALGGVKPKRRKAKSAGALSIHGLTPGVGVTLADDCHPVPGDRIVGIRRPGQGIEVHAIDCSTLSDESGEWLELSWGEGSGGAVARIAVVVHNQPGALAALTATVAAHGANIVGLALKHRDREFHTDIIDLEVDDLRQLMTIIAALRGADAVVSVERVRG